MCSVFFIFIFLFVLFHFLKITTKKKIPRILCTGTVVVALSIVKGLFCTGLFAVSLVCKKKKKGKKNKSFPDPTRTGREATESLACLIGGASVCNVNVPCY